MEELLGTPKDENIPEDGVVEAGESARRVRRSRVFRVQRSRQRFGRRKLTVFFECFASCCLSTIEARKDTRKSLVVLLHTKRSLTSSVALLYIAPLRRFFG